ncbi:hypothetical protein [Achromobacter aloeverae]|uniref:Uncharacterized protein n=1 Tax=Achromobacter aloeverae TaxID=1750518 RepID=A0A4Q1HQV1_9BURK|nr:hypothetical protein [Achromobacter aloeverae]RXN93349.1 hypothetical protein C7R54_06560 [Achromobacter aloeverae]
MKPTDNRTPGLPENPDIPVPHTPDPATPPGLPDIDLPPDGRPAGDGQPKSPPLPTPRPAAPDAGWVA